jgi:hypothetical protein
MSSERKDVMNSPDRQKPGNHPAARPGQEPDPKAAKPEWRPGEPGLQGGAPDQGATSGTGASRG